MTTPADPPTTAQRVSVERTIELLTKALPGFSSYFHPDTDTIRVATVVKLGHGVAAETIYSAPEGAEEYVANDIVSRVRADVAKATGLDEFMRLELSRTRAEAEARGYAAGRRSALVLSFAERIEAEEAVEAALAAAGIEPVQYDGVSSSPKRWISDTIVSAVIDRLRAERAGA